MLLGSFQDPFRMLLGPLRVFEEAGDDTIQSVVGLEFFRANEVPILP